MSVSSHQVNTAGRARIAFDKIGRAIGIEQDVAGEETVDRGLPCQWASEVAQACRFVLLDRFEGVTRAATEPPVGAVGGESNQPPVMRHTLKADLLTGDAPLRHPPAMEAQATEFVQASLGLIAQQALAIGGSVFGFVLGFAIALYVGFFLLRDGRAISEQLLAALPFERGIADRLAERFLILVRATIKGSVVVGLVQGALGAITFWIVGIPSVLLLGVIMAIASLLPAVGPAIVWVPAAIYLLATGAIWQGVVVIVSGVAVIGMIDNVLRPILVGRDTGIPDWMILVTTLGGIALFGLSGIVIGPLVAGLFLASWSILGEQRAGPATA